VQFGDALSQSEGSLRAPVGELKIMVYGAWTGVVAPELLKLGQGQGGDVGS